MLGEQPDQCGFNDARMLSPAAGSLAELRD
jgi:hypothetical protein